MHAFGSVASPVVNRDGSAVIRTQYDFMSHINHGTADDAQLAAALKDHPEWLGDVGPYVLSQVRLRDNKGDWPLDQTAEVFADLVAKSSDPETLGKLQKHAEHVAQNISIPAGKTDRILRDTPQLATPAYMDAILNHKDRDHAAVVDYVATHPEIFSEKTADRIAESLLKAPQTNWLAIGSIASNTKNEELLKTSLGRAAAAGAPVTDDLMERGNRLFSPGLIAGYLRGNDGTNAALRSVADAVRNDASLIDESVSGAVLDHALRTNKFDVAQAIDASHSHAARMSLLDQMTDRLPSSDLSRVVDFVPKLVSSALVARFLADTPRGHENPETVSMLTTLFTANRHAASGNDNALGRYPAEVRKAAGMATGLRGAIKKVTG